MLHDLSKEMWRLSFSVQRSKRYHDRRERFFDSLHSTTSGLNILLGSAAFASAISSFTDFNLGAWAAGSVAVLSSFDLVVGFSRKAKLHSDLKRRFTALESKIVVSPSDSYLAKYMQERLAIEIDEPPKMHALDILCHFELCRALGISPGEGVKQPNRFKSGTAQLFAWA